MRHRHGHRRHRAQAGRRGAAARARRRSCSPPCSSRRPTRWWSATAPAPSSSPTRRPSACSACRATALLGQPLGAARPDRAPRAAARPGRPAGHDQRRGRRRAAPTARACRSRSSSRRIETDDGPLLTSAMRDITDRRARRGRDPPPQRRPRAPRRRTHRASWRAPTPTSSSSPTSPRTTCRSRCAPSPATPSCSRAAIATASTATRCASSSAAPRAVARMQALIRDLLAYSRVGTRGDGFAPDRLRSRCWRDVLDDLHAGIAETGAVGHPRSAADRRRRSRRSCASSSRT